MSFRIITMELGEVRFRDLPHTGQPWVAICQDRFPPLASLFPFPPGTPHEGGVIPPHYGKTEGEALAGLRLTIRERLQALAAETVHFIQVDIEAG